MLKPNLISGKMIFDAGLLGCDSSGLATKLGNGAIPGTSGNPVKSLKQTSNPVFSLVRLAFPR